MLFCIPIAVGVTVAITVSDITSIEVVSADDVIVDVGDIIILLLVDDNTGLVSVMTDLVTTTPNVVYK